MAVLKIKAASLIEVLTSLILVLLLFVSSAYILHFFYFKGMDLSAIKERNTANALVYFAQFNSDSIHQQARERFPQKHFTIHPKEFGYSILISTTDETKTIEYVLE